MRKPRHRFAAPLVMVAAMPACFVSSNPPPPREPIVENPQEPDPDPGATEDQRWNVYADASGVCRGSVDAGECPADMACNPPPPREMACPEGVGPGESVTIVRHAGSEECMIMPPPIDCPEDAHCNPPPPRPTACPEW
jgi:hypothetical protein